jgi:cytochrome c-type biogenesis protein CcmF
MDNIIGLAGYMGLTGAFIITIFTIIIAILTHFKRFSGLQKLAVLLVHLQTTLLGISVTALAILLQTSAFQFEQVFTAVETLMRPMERIGGLWSGQAASLLFWSFIMSIAISLAVTIGKRLGQQKQTTTIILILEFTLLFFLAPDIFVSNPFVRIFRMPNGEILTAMFAPEGAQALLPIDGQGMNPSLRHIAMLLHPPTLYIGLIGFFLPYAFALAALLHQDSTHAWINKLFPMTLISFIFLTLGMLLGSWWAYTILGWGGYWGWDAVEISGLLPWLLSFGSLHAMRLTMRKKDVARWVYAFSFAIVILTLFGILITRSGILESVHSYASGPMGPILTSLVAIHLSLVLIAVIRGRKSILVRSVTGDSSFSMRINRWFFWTIVGLVLIYLFGQTLPLTSQLFTGEKLSFKPADYERYSAPLLFLLVFLTGLCPLADHYEMERRTFWSIFTVISILAFAFPIAALFYAPLSIAIFVGFWASGFLLLAWIYAGIRDVDLPILRGKPAKSWSRRLGMVIIHLGFAVMAVGIIGVETTAYDYSLTLSPDIPAEFEQFIFTYNTQTSIFVDKGNPIYTADITILMPNNRQITSEPTITHYVKTGMFYVTPAIKPGFFQDVQVVLNKFPPSPKSNIDIHIAVFPLISWIWAGGALIAIGGVLPLFLRRME